MQRWEYMYGGNICILKTPITMCTSINGQRGNQPYPNLAECLNRVGNDGWELVGVGAATNISSGGCLFFKRPKP